MFNWLRIKTISIISFCLFIILITLSNFINLGKLSDRKIKLGVDLRNGKQVLLEIDSDSYIKEKLSDIIDDLKLSFKENQIRAIPKLRIDLQEGKESYFYIQIEVKRVSDLDKIKSVLSKIDEGLVFEAKNDVVNVKFKDSTISKIEKMLITKTIKTIEKRVFVVGENNFVFHKKDRNKILVQTSNEENIEKLKENISKSGVLTFNFVSTKKDFDLSAITNLKRVKAINSEYKYLIEKKPILTGDQLIDAQVIFYRGNPVVFFQFNAQGTQKFAQITKANIGKSLAIVLDNEVIMAPRISSPITNGSGMISGNFTEEEATEIAKTLKAGALLAPIIVLEEQNYESALSSNLLKNLIRFSLTLTIVFVIFFFAVYKQFGLFATVSFIMNIGLIITILSLFNINLFYSGIKALILSILIYLFLNVLVFEKMRRIRKKGRSMLSSIEQGFEINTKIVLSAVLILVLACVMFLFGNYSVQNFSLVLIIGFLSSMFMTLLFMKALIMLGLNRFKLTKAKF